MCAREARLIEVNFVNNEHIKVIVGFYSPSKCTNVCFGSGGIFPNNYGCNLRNPQKEEKEEESSCSSKIPPNNNCTCGRKWIDLMQKRGMIPDLVNSNHFLPAHKQSTDQVQSG